MLYQATVKLGTSSSIKTGLCKSSRRDKSQKQTTEPEKAPNSLLGSHIKNKIHICNICGEGPVQFHACSLVVVSVSVSSYEPRLVDPWVFLWFPWTQYFLQSFLSLFCKITQALPNVWRWVSASEELFWDTINFQKLEPGNAKWCCPLCPS